MKALILTISAGGGHNSTARAVKRGLEQRGITCEILDVFYYLSKLLGETVSKGYEVTIDLKSAYRTVYRQLEKRRSNSYTMSPTRLTSMAMAQKLRGYIDGFDPDVIVCTHIFPGIMIDALKQLGETRARMVAILTDFDFHPYWEEALRFDYIVTACEYLNDKALKKGFRPDQILPIGIPIDPKFASLPGRDEARKALGLPSERPVALYMSGSMGYGNIEKSVRTIDSSSCDLTTVVICGRNEQAVKKLSRMKLKKDFVILGFTSDVYKYMAAADFIITKPGGLTTSEALASRLPIIIDNPIPGQEERNTEFLLNAGAAMLVTETFSLDDAVHGVVDFPERRRLMRESIDLIRKPNSTSDLCDYISRMG